MLRKIVLAIGVFVALTALIAAGQLPQVISAVKSGNAKNVSAFFDARTRIVIDGKTTVNNAAGAQAALNSFFTTNTVSGFSVTHEMDRDKASICIGTLSTNKGNYRTTIQVRERNGKSVIEELRIEK